MLSLMKIRRIQRSALLLICVFVSKGFSQNISRFAFSPNPTESRDHLVLSFPEASHAIIDGLALSIQASTDLLNWETIQTVYFERNAIDEIEGFLIGSELQVTESGGGLELVWVKKKERYANGFLIFRGEPLSYVSDNSEEIFISIGNHVIREVVDGYWTYRYLEYTERTRAQFFRIIPSTLTIED